MINRSSEDLIQHAHPLSSLGSVPGHLPSQYYFSVPHRSEKNSFMKCKHPKRRLNDSLIDMKCEMCSTSCELALRDTFYEEKNTLVFAGTWNVLFLIHTRSMLA